MHECVTQNLQRKVYVYIFALYIQHFKQPNSAKSYILPSV